MFLGSSFLGSGSTSSAVTTITRTDTTTSTTASSTPTFSDASFGTATSDTHLVVVLGFRRDAVCTPQSMTVGGDGMTRWDYVGSTSSQSTGAAIFYKKIGTTYGNSADVVATMSVSARSHVMMAYTFEKSGSVSLDLSAASKNNSVTTITEALSPGGGEAGIGIFVSDDDDAGTPTWSSGLTDNGALVLTSSSNSLVELHCIGGSATALASGSTNFTGSGATSGDLALAVALFS